MRKLRTGTSVVAAVVLALGLAGCGSEDPAPGAASPSSAPSTAGEPGTSGYEIVTVERDVPDEWVREAGDRPVVSANLVARMGDLGVDLWQYQRVQKPAANAWVSPVSLYQALSLLAPGVGPDAIDELLAAMGLDAAEIGVNTDELADWITASRRSEYQLALYNAAFVAQQYGGFAPGYLGAIEPVRDELGGFDALDPQGTADFINSRVAEHTHGTIDQILQPTDIRSDLVTILLNATFFKGTWVHQFDPGMTSEGDFTLLDGSIVPAERMNQMGVPLAVTEADGYSAAVLPYEGGAKAVIVLPDQGRFEEVAVGLTAPLLRELAAAEPSGNEYWLSLPRFTSDSGIQGLVPALQAMGVSRLFEEEGTPNWPMFGNGDDHYVMFVKQRVVVAVDERGTEASAATAIGAGLGGNGPGYYFSVNRPFVMAILDADDALLFLGQIVDPR